MTVSHTTILSGRTCPYIITSTAAKVNAVGGVVARKISISSPADLPLSSFRLYVPAYESDPTEEAQLLKIKPVRAIQVPAQTSISSLLVALQV